MIQELLVCAATLLHFPVPPPPIVLHMDPLPKHLVERTSNPNPAAITTGSRKNVVLVFLSKRANRAVILHEMAHVVQIHNGQNPGTPENEAQARSIQSLVSLCR